MITIIDDFLPKTIQDEIEQFCTSVNMTWFYGQKSLGEYTDTDVADVSIKNLPNFRDSYQFTHNLFTPDGKSSFAKEFFMERITNNTILENVEFSRIKLNLTFPIIGYPINCPNFPHIDNFKTCPFTGLYYVNDSDGDTLIFNEKYDKNTHYDSVTVQKRVTPKKGRLLIFNSDQLHTSSLPYTSEKRIVINMNFRNKNG